ncbi:S-layer homology domain-containing protein [Ammoniphilus sp. YIM 78166]|uniref:S-layer homology domain-containing protein n=1 Tax=Ammoniphilus sp. YIM 78166 TaxID=1644106 RepID=UPI00142FD928|nr:S-layer homology domain-containing protein [Ammoniphilus sp. YIM 78166]
MVAGAGLTFKDAEHISTWAVNAVRLATQLGLMRGMSNERFSPRSSATRAQAAAVVLRAMEQLGMIGE